MGQIWIRMKYDEEMGMDIPHNVNFATAMYGFRDLGAIIRPYHKITDIIDEVTAEDICVDYIDQCLFVFDHFGKTPSVPNYPEVLRPFLGRKVWQDTINSIASDEKKWSAGNFVKPIREKAFTGKIISSLKDLVGTGSGYENYDVLVSEPIRIAAEWRCFILKDRIVDVRPYGLLMNEDYDGYLYHYDASVLSKMMESFRKWEDRPDSCSIDICVTRDGRTLLLEVNDCLSLGCYGLPGVVYAKMISARWSQVLEREDEYNF